MFFSEFFVKSEKKMESDNFTLERFSTDLITECFLQQLETPVPTRHYAGNMYTDGVRKWIKLTDTLIHCLKNDLRGCKGGKSNAPVLADNVSITQHPQAALSQTRSNPRTSVALVICNWAKDMNSLKELYEEKYFSKIKEDRVQKEIDMMYTYLSNLCDLARYISQRKKEQEDLCTRERCKEEEETCSKSEMVFIFDDHESSLNN